MRLAALILFLVLASFQASGAKIAARDLVAQALATLHNLPAENSSTAREAALASATELFTRAVFGGDQVVIDDKELHRWLANAGLTHALRGHRRTAAGVLSLAVQLNPLDGWLWDRCVAVLGEADFVAHRCPWEPHAFFYPDVIHGSFYTRQLDVAEAVLYLSYLQQHNPRMLPNEETPSVNMIVALLNFLRQQPVDGAVRGAGDQAAIEQARRDASLPCLCKVPAVPAAPLRRVRVCDDCVVA
jgi:hypothetical protein